MDFYTPKELLRGPLKGKISKNPLYEGLRSGRIPSIRPSARRILIPADWVARMLGDDLADKSDSE